MDKDTVLILALMVGVGYIVLRRPTTAPVAVGAPAQVAQSPLQQAQSWLQQLVGSTTAAAGGSQQQAAQAAGIAGAASGLAGALAQLFGSQSAVKGVPEYGVSGSDTVSGGSGTGGFTGNQPSLGGGLTLNGPSVDLGGGSYGGSSDDTSASNVPTGQSPSLGGYTLSGPDVDLGDMAG